MPEAHALQGALQGAPGTQNVSLGRRLQGRALAPDLAVYMAKQPDDKPVEGPPFEYRLVIRLGLDVQEMVVVSSLVRDAFRETLASAVTAMSGE